MDKKTLYDCIEKNKDVLIDLSDHIWEFAELSMLEYKSAEYYCQLLENLGFTVERKLCGIPTAFSGSYGSGRPVIGLLGEFDALDGLSQQAASAERRAFSAENTCGHGCGHNLLGTASLGAALMTGTSVTQRQLDGTASTLSNEVLEKLLYQNFLQAPLPEYTPEEWELASQLKATFTDTGLPGKCTADYPEVKAAVMEKSDGGKKALNDFVIPYVHANSYASGSTDVGDVSWLTPTAQFTAVTWASGSPGHSWQNVSLGRSSIGYKGVLLAAKVLAGSVADLMEDASLLQKARTEFNVSATGGYDCPIEKGVIPGPQAL